MTKAKLTRTIIAAARKLIAGHKHLPYGPTGQAQEVHVALIMADLTWQDTLELAIELPRELAERCPLSYRDSNSPIELMHRNLKDYVATALENEIDRLM